MQTTPKQIPILFSTPMVQAIIAGRKTQTRRIVKSKSEHGFRVHSANYEPNFPGYYHNRQVEEINEEEMSTGKIIYCPYGQIGDVLWCRESWNTYKDAYYFKADDNMDSQWGKDVRAAFALAGTKLTDFASSVKWKPSIHMPRSACRLFL